MVGHDDASVVFQSTPLRERRHGDKLAAEEQHTFNPRLYARGDSTIYIILIQILPIELSFLLSILLPNAQGYQKSYIK